jgi:hypothetical protein
MPRDFNKYNYINQQDYESVASADWPSFADFQRHQNIDDLVYDQVDVRLSPARAFDHPSYCVLPFFGLDYPARSPCCLMKAPIDLPTIRTDMLQGQRPKSCQVCWDLEDVGIKSDRQIKNETLDFYLDRNIQDLFDDCVQGNYQITHYKIDTSNTCNATCATCSSYSSSSWAQLERRNQMTPAPAWHKVSPEQADSMINYNTAAAVNFRGGEPLLSETNFHILKQLIRANNTECFISFQTNGSIRPSSDREKILLAFKNLNFSFSIDGVGPVFEYVRFPLKWNSILETLSWCRQHNIQVSVSYTVSNLNVLYHQQTTQWFEKNNLRYHVNPVYKPAWFSPNVLPLQVKSKIDFEFLNSNQDDTNWQIFKVKIDEQDRWKGISMRDYLPELAEVLG